MVKQNEQFEVCDNWEETQEVANQRKLEIEDATEREFHSKEITINGKVYEEGSRNKVLRDDPKYLGKGPKERSQAFLEQESQRIPGLFCPDCHALAFKTDQKEVAVCGDYPGWYFFYRKIDADKYDDAKVKYVLINGELVAVEDQEPDVRKEQV